MSNYIVLVKQVPDISQITDNVFNPETGTLIRSRLENTINELDAQALAFANHMKRISKDDNAQIIALSMGPLSAEDVLKYSLSRCADKAILLTDQALGGADTYATANPLAMAIRKIKAELFANSDDYFVVAGMQSVDGDTAQVPAQIAEDLNIGCLPYLSNAYYDDGKFKFKSYLSDAGVIISARKLPAVLTIAKYEYPAFASFSKTRKANRIPIQTWNADDIGAIKTGVRGSKTRVIKIFPPGKTSRKCQQIENSKKLVSVITQAYYQNTCNSLEMKKSYQLPKKRESIFDRTYESLDKENEDYRALLKKMQELKVDSIDKANESILNLILSDKAISFHKKTLESMLKSYKSIEPTYNGQVWVIAEVNNEKVTEATFELIGKAIDLARDLETTVGVVIAGKNVKSHTDILIAAGANDIYIAEDELLASFDPAAYKKVLANIINKYSPQIILSAATPKGRIISPMIAYRLHCGLTADCTSLEIKDSSRQGIIGALFQTRPALGGNIMATICTKDSTMQFATARPGIMKRKDPDYTRAGNIHIEEIELTVEDMSINIMEHCCIENEVNFKTEVIISGGKGLQNKDNYDELIQSLSNAISETLETKTEIGATRAAVEQGFTERIRQVGQTGTAISPKLYIALGISGAIQHMIGVSNTETIVAINNDPHAPIFSQCDYYIVGNVEEIVPELINELRSIG